MALINEVAFSIGSLDQVSHMLLWVSEHSWYLPGSSLVPHLIPARFFSLQAACQYGNWETPNTHFLKLVFYACLLPSSPHHCLEVQGSQILSLTAPGAPDPIRSCRSLLGMSYWARWRFPERSSKEPLLKHPGPDRSSCLDATSQNSTLHTVLSCFTTDPQLPRCVNYLLFI